MEAMTHLQFSGSRVAVLSGPESLKLRGNAGEDAVFRLQVTNNGDSPLSIDPQGVVPLRLPGALAKNVKETFRNVKGDFITRLIALGKSLESETTTEAAIVYKADFEQLAPGQTAEIEIHLHLPQNAGAFEEWRTRVPLFGNPVEAVVRVATDRT